MYDIAVLLKDSGYILRSGHAKGADQAFEAGAREEAIVYLPYETYNEEDAIYGLCWKGPTARAGLIAARHHPNWRACSRTARLMHSRNAHIILGSHLYTGEEKPDPVDFVICWTPNGDPVGGTSQALRIAEAYEIPIWNLGLDNDVRVWGQWIEDFPYEPSIPERR